MDSHRSRIYIAYNFKPDLQIRLRHFKADALTQLFSLGSKMFVINLANLIIVTQFFGPVGVSLYLPGKVLTQHSREFVNAFRQQLFPLTTGYNITGKTEKLQQILIKATQYSTLMDGRFKTLPPFFILFTINLGNRLQKHSFSLHTHSDILFQDHCQILARSLLSSFY